EAEAPRLRGAFRGRDRELVLDAAGSDVRRGVPAGDRRDLDDVAGVRRVDEAVAADVDADMAEPVEEDEVAGLEIAPRDRGTHPVLRVRAVRQRDADLREGVHHEAGTVEARRGRPAPPVRNAEVALRH